MVELIFKNEIGKKQMDTLLYILRSWDIEAEVKTGAPILSKKKSSFSLSAGMWKDYSIDGDQLRKQAWNRNN